MKNGSCASEHAASFPVLHDASHCQRVKWYPLMFLVRPWCGWACNAIEPTKHRPNLVNAAKTAMSSKILGPESSFFAEMAVDAVTAVRTESTGDLGKKVGFPPHTPAVLQIYLPDVGTHDNNSSRTGAVAVLK